MTTSERQQSVTIEGYTNVRESGRATCLGFYGVHVTIDGVQVPIERVKALAKPWAPLALEQAREDASQLRLHAAGLSYNDTTAEGEAKHRLREIAMRIETGFYAGRAFKAGVRVGSGLERAALALEKVREPFPDLTEQDDPHRMLEREHATIYEWLRAHSFVTDGAICFGAGITQKKPELLDEALRAAAVLSASKPSEPPSAQTATPQSGWQPIETGPKDGTCVLLGRAKGVWVGKYHPVYQSGYKPDNSWASMMLNHDHMAERYGPATHWMPLPKAPE